MIMLPASGLLAAKSSAPIRSVSILLAGLLAAMQPLLGPDLVAHHVVRQKGRLPKGGVRPSRRAGAETRKELSQQCLHHFDGTASQTLRRVCRGVAGTVSCNGLARWRDVSCTAVVGVVLDTESTSAGTFQTDSLDGLARRETTLCQPSSGRCSPGNVRLHSLGHRGRLDSWK